MEAYKKWLKKTLRVELVEGVGDPGILKAVFLAGGPGSGKSTYSKYITKHFEIPHIYTGDMMRALSKKDTDLEQLKALEWQTCSEIKIPPAEN